MMDAPAPASRPVTRAGRLASRVSLAIWLPVLLTVCSYLLGGHLLTLSKPSAEGDRLAALVTNARGLDRERWFVLHILYKDCRCSQRVLEHLIARHASAGIRERIVLVGESHDLAARVTAAGFEIDTLTSDQLERRYGVQAAPLMIASDPSNHIRYVGGYTDRKQGPIFRDLEITARLARGETVAPLPLFGCAVSAKLEAKVDPLGLRR